MARGSRASPRPIPGTRQSDDRSRWRDVRFALGPTGLFAWRVTFTGFPVDAVAYPFPGLTPGEAFEVKEQAAMALEKGKMQRKVAGGSAPLTDDKAFRIKYPQLWAYLSQKVWDDGTARQPSSLLVFEQDGIFKCMVRDKDAGLCCWVASPTLSELFSAIEAALVDPGTEWRVDRQQEGQAAKRVKRQG